MICSTMKPCKAFVVVVLLTLVVVNLFPGVIRSKPPANSDATYSEGWKDACRTSLNTQLPIRTWLLDAPSVKKTLDEKGNYKQGWNEGFTVCRFAQDSVDKWAQTLLIIAALLLVFRSNKATQ